MNVAYLFPNFFFIGAQRAAAATMRQLQQRGHTVSAYVIDPQGTMQNELEPTTKVVAFNNQSWLAKIPFFRLFSWPFALRKILQQERPDVLVSICPQTNFTMVLYRLFFGKDVIFIGEEHLHFSNALKNDPAEFKRPWRYLYYFSVKNYHRLDLLRCVSRAIAQDFVENWGVPKEKACTVYPAFDLARIQSRSHDARRNNTVPVICAVGRLTSQKDFALLIRAFAYVKTQCDAVLHIAGTGPEKAALQALIQSLGLEQHAKLLGFVEYAEELIASADVFVMTSIWEGFPATLVESMVLGTPVISVDCLSGPAELIEPNVSGILVQQRDPEIIGQAIVQLLNNPAQRLEMAQKAQERVQKFSLESTVRELEAAMNQQLKNQSR